MKYAIILQMFLPFMFVLHGQEASKTELIGTLSLDDNQLISYKINYTMTGDNTFEGTSITDFLGGNLTKSKIIGDINLSKKKISFKEVSNISTLSIEEDSVFCYVQVKSLKMRDVNGKTIVSGPFKGKYPNGKVCANGQLYLVSSNIIQELKEKAIEMNIGKDTLARVDSILAEIDMKEEAEVLTSNNSKMELQWTSDDIIIDIWDGSSEDYDAINIYFNGKIIKKQFTIKNEKQTIRIPFTEEFGVLKIVAINEGLKETNTVNFLLRGPDKIQPFISILNRGEEVTVEFRKD